MKTAISFCIALASLLCFSFTRPDTNPPKRPLTVTGYTYTYQNSILYVTAHYPTSDGAYQILVTVNFINSSGHADWEMVDIEVPAGSTSAYSGQSISNASGFSFTTFGIYQ